MHQWSLHSKRFYVIDHWVPRSRQRLCRHQFSWSSMWWDCIRPNLIQIAKAWERKWRPPYFVCHATPLVSHRRFIAVSWNAESSWPQFSCGAGAGGRSGHFCRPICVDASFPQHGPHIQGPHKLRVKPILEYEPKWCILPSTWLPGGRPTCAREQQDAARFGYLHRAQKLSSESNQRFVHIYLPVCSWMSHIIWVVVILASSCFRDYLQGSRGGESIWYEFLILVSFYNYII